MKETGGKTKDYEETEVLVKREEPMQERKNKPKREREKKILAYLARGKYNLPGGGVYFSGRYTNPSPRPSFLPLKNNYILTSLVYLSSVSCLVTLSSCPFCLK